MFVMSLYEKWNDLITSYESQEEYNAFWSEYIPKEQSIYEEILEKRTEKLEGKISELASAYGYDPLTFMGFLDGLNSSFKESLDLEALEEDSKISAVIDFEKLFYNMHDANADWLYSLPQWNDILSSDQQDEIRKSYNESKIFKNDSKKVGRNDPCPCGSGKKYKKCCLNK